MKSSVDYLRRVIIRENSRWPAGHCTPLPVMNPPVHYAPAVLFGLCIVYHRFAPSLARTDSSLTYMLRKGVPTLFGDMSDRAHAAFVQLKFQFASPPSSPFLVTVAPTFWTRMPVTANSAVSWCSGTTTSPRCLLVTRAGHCARPNATMIRRSSSAWSSSRLSYYLGLTCSTTTALSGRTTRPYAGF